MALSEKPRAYRVGEHQEGRIHAPDKEMPPVYPDQPAMERLFSTMRLMMGAERNPAFEKVWHDEYQRARTIGVNGQVDTTARWIREQLSGLFPSLKPSDATLADEVQKRLIELAQRNPGPINLYDHYAGHHNHQTPDPSILAKARNHLAACIRNEVRFHLTEEDPIAQMEVPQLDLNRVTDRVYNQTTIQLALNRVRGVLDHPDRLRRFVDFVREDGQPCRVNFTEEVIGQLDLLHRIGREQNSVANAYPSIVETPAYLIGKKLGDGNYLVDRVYVPGFDYTESHRIKGANHRMCIGHLNLRQRKDPHYVLGSYHSHLGDDDDWAALSDQDIESLVWTMVEDSLGELPGLDPVLNIVHPKCGAWGIYPVYPQKYKALSDELWRQGEGGLFQPVLREDRVRYIDAWQPRTGTTPSQRAFQLRRRVRVHGRTK